MKRATALLTLIAFFAICSTAFALYSVSYKGEWPKTWPAELEPLREHAHTLVGPMVEQRHYEIPFTDRAEFEKAWPPLLEVKSKGAPIILVRAPNTWMDMTINAGVIVRSPPASNDKRANPETPIPGQSNVRVRWMNTTFIELIVDGKIVDLNRIPLPEETPIIDERFKAADRKMPNPTDK